jgi:hypothetical protein
MNVDIEIDEIMNEAELLGDNQDFEAELFLSTDGKQTVHVKASTKEGRASAIKWAKVVFEAVRSRYGTKQELNAKTYNPPLKKVDPNAPICAIHNAPMTLKPAGVSKTTNKPYPAFWSCGERLSDGSFCKYRPNTNAI